MIMMGIVAFSTTANVLVCIFQCAPIQKAWDLSITDGRCDVNINAFYIANAVTNIATDVLTYVLPIGLIHDLHIPSRQKIAVGVMLCLGFLQVMLHRYETYLTNTVHVSPQSCELHMFPCFSPLPTPPTLSPMLCTGP